MKHILLFVFTFLIGCSPAKYRICPYNATGASARLKMQVSIKLDPSVPPEFVSCISKASKVWNDYLNFEMFSPNGFMDLPIVWFSGPSDLKDGEQARTTISWTNDTIESVIIKVNARTFQYSDNPEFTQVDCESLMIHELGHALGLGHIDDSKSVMNPTLPNAEIRRTLYEKEESAISCMYQ